MTEEMTKTEAPAMLVLRRNNYLFGYDKVLANSRVQRRTYIVDTVFDRAILVSGRDKVTIARVPGKVHEINTNCRHRKITGQSRRSLQVNPTACAGSITCRSRSASAWLRLLS